MIYLALFGPLLLFISGAKISHRRITDNPALLNPPQSVVDVGNHAPLIRYNKNIRGGAYTDGAFSGGWQITQALAVRAGNKSADAKMMEQVKYDLEGDNTICANGGYPAQHERHMTGAYAILRFAPQFWNNRLSPEQRWKITLLMKASLVGSAYTTADATYANGATVTTIDGDTNLNRDWNPNYREGMIGGMLVATVFFGGVDSVYQILEHYDHQSFVGELKKASLGNTYKIFTWAEFHPDSKAPSGEKIEKNIHDYRYKGKRLMDPFDLYYALTLYTYGKNVNCGLNDGKGIVVDGLPTGVIVSGCDSLPNKGKPGMLLEFDSRDAPGPRSSIDYSYDGFRPNLTNHVVVIVGGYWQEGPKADEILQRMDIGITDLMYKLKHGYRDYSKGHGSAHVIDMNTERMQWTYKTTLPLWKDVIRPYHVRNGEMG